MTPDRQFRSPVRHFWRWLIPALLLWAFALQGTRGLWSPDEGRYVDVALEMLKSGDWLRPHVNDEFAHVTKPPLTYWAVASSVELFGRHEWAARLPHALAFALSVLLVGAMGRRLVPERPWLPALVYATFVLPYVAAHVITTDTLLAFFTTAYAAAFVEARARRDSRGAGGYVAAGWAAAGLAFLAKGPPGLLPLAGLALFAWSERRIVGPTLYLSWSGLLLFVVLGFGWYLRVAFDQPDLVRYFLVDEFWNRLSSPQSHRNADAIGAVRVYGGTLLLGTLPWTWPLLRDLSRSLAAAARTAAGVARRSPVATAGLLDPGPARGVRAGALAPAVLPAAAVRAAGAGGGARGGQLVEPARRAAGPGRRDRPARAARLRRPGGAARGRSRAGARDRRAAGGADRRGGLRQHGATLRAGLLPRCGGRAPEPGRRTADGAAPAARGEVPLREGCRILLVEARSAAALRSNLATGVGSYRRIGAAGRYTAYVVPGGGCD